MRLPLLFVLSIAFAGCESKPGQPSASAMEKDEPLKAGDLVPESMLYDDPPISNDPSQMLFFGLKEGDPAHRLYSLPTSTPLAQIVDDFEIGAHGAESYSWDIRETIQLVADKVEAIAKVIPCRVTFADSAGLKLLFLRPITDVDLYRIVMLFTEEEMMQAGLEGYLSEWDGQGPIFARVAEENAIHLWWD